MINTDNVLISNQDVHVICTILTVYVGLSVLLEFPIPVTLWCYKVGLRKCCDWRHAVIEGRIYVTVLDGAVLDIK